jgi:Tfp pilus assembly protein FimT
MLVEVSRSVPTRTGEAGKSLVEAAIVCMLFAIVAAFALPAVARSIRAYNLRSAAQHVAERLAGGRALAMSKNKSVTVSFRSSDASYGYDFSPVGAPDGIPDASDPDDTTQSYYVDVMPSGMSFAFVAGGTVLANGMGITYTSRGELPIGATQTDILVSNSSGSMTVSVNLRGEVWVH